MRIPFLEEKELRRRARDFLSKHNPKGTIPVPIETIVEFGFRLDIVPVPGLLKDRGINGFLTSDRSSIFVDDSLLRVASTRYFFTLAHELSHLVLHGSLYPNFKDDQEWKRFHVGLAAHTVASAEWQADTFAGLVLVPTEPLAEELAACFPLLAKTVRAGDPSFNMRSPALWHYVAQTLGKTFQVSRDTARIRLENDGLWCKPPVPRRRS